MAEASRTSVPAHNPAATAQAQQYRLRALRRHDWMVYAKTPLATPATVLDYLARYMHCVAISNERLVGIDAGKVRLRAKRRAGLVNQIGTHPATN